MRRFVRAAAAAAASLALLAAPAFATSGPPYLVEVAGQTAVDTPFSAAGGSSSMTIPLMSWGCNSTSMSGTVLAGDTSSSPSVTTHVADITDSVWNSCTGPLGLRLSYQHNGTWELHATDPVTDGTSDVVPGYIDNISLTISQAGNPAACVFAVEGRAQVEFREDTQELVVNQPRNADLQVTSVTGCYGLVRVGDPFSLEMTLQLGEEGNPSTPLPINLRPTE